MPMGSQYAEFYKKLAAQMDLIKSKKNNVLFYVKDGNYYVLNTDKLWSEQVTLIVHWFHEEFFFHKKELNYLDYEQFIEELAKYCEINTHYELNNGIVVDDCYTEEMDAIMYSFVNSVTKAMLHPTAQAEFLDDLLN